MAVALTYEMLRDHYRELLDAAQVTATMSGVARDMASKILSAKDRYTAVEAATNVPWFMVGIIHAMEAGCSWKCHLHNGDPLSTKTVCVPAGRPLRGKGPFTWEESAIDALEMKKLRGITWTLERALFELERYNGQGYLKHHPDVPSPYLWSGTTVYTKGKYVADGKWSATAVSKQVGAYPLLVYLSHADESAALPRDEVVPVEATTADSFRKAVPEDAAPETKPAATSNTIQAAFLSSAGSGLVLQDTVNVAVKRSHSLLDFVSALVINDAGINWAFLGSLVAAMYSCFVIYHRWQQGDIEGLFRKVEVGQ